MEITAKYAAELAAERKAFLLGNLSLSEEGVELKREIALRESEIMFNVTQETDGKGKPRYSNAEARKAEAAVREEGDTWLRGKRKDLTSIERELKEREISIQHTSDLLRIVIAFAGQLVPGELLESNN